ncbi:hypothetical protein LIER_16342 [Lithospermum erythrorhizon]|uniref:Expansin-like B1 n=1 Tax=Lithospermum erythrorhizon TaxID=34254 RepID=A0AAV3QAG6_LITER
MIMGFAFRYCSVLLSILILSPAMCSNAEYYYSRATYFGSPKCKLANPTGACGYGEYGMTINNGDVSGVSHTLWKNGTGCGACYQVRCKNNPHCSEDGTNIIVTDYGEGHYTDFILTASAYAKMAQSNMASALYSYGVVDVEYKRIPCTYSSYNLVLKVHEHSKNPSYLAVIPLYQAGVSDINSMEVWLEDCKEWRAMRRVYGTVYDLENPPMGVITVRIQVSTNGETKWVQLTNVIPTEWKAGATYDTSIQLN